VFTVALGDADTRRRSEAGGGGVSEQAAGDDEVADRVELGLDRDSGQSHRRALLHFPEDGELGRRRDLIEIASNPSRSPCTTYSINFAVENRCKLDSMALVTSTKDLSERTVTSTPAK
jgi:hypothetical protein